jgi:hypothetical protein
MTNEIETVKQEIRVLEAKLQLLESIDEHKDREVRKAFKDAYGYYPQHSELSWVGFQKGWEASQKNQNNIEEILDNPTTLPKPQMSEFRQKLFDGIESIFYNDGYKNTHWEMKVNMAVDEVLSHFYDVIPDENEVPYDKYEKGWNDCIDAIKGGM